MTTTLQAPDIVCEGCATSIKTVLRRLNGVSQVGVNVSSQTVTVEHDTSLSRDDLAKTLLQAGYPTSAGS